MAVDLKDLTKRLRNEAGWITNEFSGRVQMSKSEALAVAEKIESDATTDKLQKDLAKSRKFAAAAKDREILSREKWVAASHYAASIKIDLDAITTERNMLARAIKNIIESDDDTIDSRMLYNNMLLNLMELSETLNLEDY